MKDAEAYILSDTDKCCFEKRFINEDLGELMKIVFSYICSTSFNLIVIRLAVYVELIIIVKTEFYVANCIDVEIQ